MNNADFDPVELLRSMVEIPSLSGEEATLAAHLEGRMSALGFDAHTDKAGNAVGEVSGPGAQERQLIMLGHMDVVPGDVPVRREDDLLYGRGTVDAKGPLATFIAAAATAKIPPGLNVVVVGAVEEESATSKGARFIAERAAPDYCIIGEPSGWDAITLGYKGRMLVKYTLERSVSHTAGPEESVAQTAVRWWNGLHEMSEKFNEGKDKLFAQLMPSLRSFTTTTDGLTDRVVVHVGFRLPADMPPCDLEPLVCAQPGHGEPHIVCTGKERAHSSSRGGPLVRALLPSIRTEGVTPRFKLKTGTSDMNVVGPVWKCPIVAYGPGDSMLDHTPNEHISIIEFKRAVGVLRRAIESL